MVTNKRKKSKPKKVPPHVKKAEDLQSKLKAAQHNFETMRSRHDTELNARILRDAEVKFIRGQIFEATSTVDITDGETSTQKLQRHIGRQEGRLWAVMSYIDRNK